MTIEMSAYGVTALTPAEASATSGGNPGFIFGMIVVPIVNFIGMAAAAASVFIIIRGIQRGWSC
ncbi:hypothetical protein [Microvirga lotononidis]|uniref:hypothetical protein n=1 Tax=Microvirga lotononidis TaxID=864069 RepID=UPI0012B57B1F|nr:hypothetical protein [Microvirga lotononidis]WQO30347.1 hypothetical protein U0023_29205 [Microvirga lotononidis]